MREIIDIGLIGLGAAAGAGFASTGRVLSPTEAEKPWPYLVVMAVGATLLGFEKTRMVGIGMTAYGMAKSILKLTSWFYAR